MPTELILWFGVPTLAEAKAPFVVWGLEARNSLHLPPTPPKIVLSLLKNGGEGGIRTHGTVSRTLAFEASTFNRSVTSPRSVKVD
jgi:hypothetical protein